MVLIYLALLSLGILCFLAHYLAQWQIIRRLRRQHPRQWAIIQPPDRPARWPMLWVRITMVMKSTVPPLPVLLNDPILGRWQALWRWAPRLAWLSWLGALGLRLLAR